MIKAVIDLGTNSIRLAVGEKAAAGHLCIIGQQVLYTRIGEGMGSRGYIQEMPLKRNVEAVKQLVEQAQQWGAETIRLTATSAIREAVNRQEVCRIIGAETGIPVEVLSGEMEAQLSYLGASGDFLADGQLLAVLDIGGGSTELVYPVAGALRRASVPVGAVRLAEGQLSLENSNQLLKQLIEQPLPKDAVLIGVGGTNTCLAAIEQQLAVYQGDKVHGAKLCREQVAAWVNKLLPMTVEQRAKIPGLTPERADILPYGACILLQMMDLLQRAEIIVSDKGLIYGALLEA